MAEQLGFLPTGGGSNPTSPLNMYVRQVRHDTAAALYAEWHYLKDTAFIATINMGAYFDNILHGAISYGPPNATDMAGFYTRNDQRHWWEIKRLAMTDAAPRCSESRFISVSLRLLRKLYKVIGVISLADDSVGHKGTIYKASGFKYLGKTAPKKDYYVNGAIHQRGPVRGLGGEWRDRPIKHLFVKDFRAP